MLGVTESRFFGRSGSDNRLQWVEFSESSDSFDSLLSIVPGDAPLPFLTSDGSSGLSEIARKTDLALPSLASLEFTPESVLSVYPKKAFRNQQTKGSLKALKERNAVFDEADLDGESTVSNIEKPWESENLEDLLDVPEALTKTLPNIQLSLGDFKALAVYYINRFSRFSCGVPNKLDSLCRSVSNRHLLDRAASAGLSAIICRLHFGHIGQLPLLTSHQRYLEYRSAQKEAFTARRSVMADLIGKHTAEDGKVSYFEGIELILGRERDSVLRPMVYHLFQTQRAECKRALEIAGLKCKDLRNWTVVEFCKALHFLGTLVDSNVWNQAVMIHKAKIFLYGYRGKQANNSVIECDFQSGTLSGNDSVMIPECVAEQRTRHSNDAGISTKRSVEINDIRKKRRVGFTGAGA